MQRTIQQNKSIHLFLSRLSDTLNEAGYDQRKVLKETVEIPWTPQACKEQLWRPIQNALYGKQSTTELEKLEQVSKVHEVLMKHLGEKLGIDYLDFPHMKDGAADKDGKIHIDL